VRNFPMPKNLTCPVVALCERCGDECMAELLRTGW